MKILVVDDDLASRKKMQVIMQDIGECEVVENGTGALQAFTRAWESWTPFDLIALDIVMPDLDGTEVLNRIRQIEEERKIPKNKRVTIFMVTSRSEKNTIMACIQAGCDDFITKPFNRETVAKKLVNRGFKLASDPSAGGKNFAAQEGRKSKSAFIESIISRFKRGNIDLPAMPRIHEKFKELVDKGATLQNIAELLRQDPAISSRLISISNSSYYRGLTENKTLESAIARLGLAATKQTVSAIANRGMYTTTNKKYTQIVDNLWVHSLSCACAAQLTAGAVKERFGEDAFTLGLLHDIGKLIMVQVVGEIEKRTPSAGEEDILEMFKVLDAYHGKTGGVLLKKWGFSDVYFQVSVYHDSFEEAADASRELQIVHFSNLLVKSMGFGPGEPSDIMPEETVTARLLGLSVPVIAEIREKVVQQLDSMKQCLE